MAVRRSTRFRLGRRLAIAIAGIITAAWASPAVGLQRAPDDRAATASAAASVGQTAPVVLKDGTILQAVSVSYNETTVWLRFADGHKEVHPVSDVDVEASRGLAGLHKNQPRRSRTRKTQSGELASFARKTKLKIPEDKSQTESNTENVKSAGGTLSIGSTTYSNSGPSDTTDGPGQSSSNLPIGLLADLQGLASGWSGFDLALAEVNTICTGYIQGRSSCGGSKVVSKRNTAYCRDAINRARTHLPNLETAHTRLWDGARRSGVAPGDVRAALRQRGLGDFRSQIDQAQATLNAWHGNLVD